MDRRKFLKTLGIGGVLTAVAPSLVLPAARTAIAEPHRTLFLPPAGGWPTRAFTLSETSMGSARTPYVDRIFLPAQSTITLEGYYDPSLDVTLFGGDLDTQVVISFPEGGSYACTLVGARLDLSGVDAATYRLELIPDNTFRTEPAEHLQDVHVNGRRAYATLVTVDTERGHQIMRGPYRGWTPA